VAGEHVDISRAQRMQRARPYSCTAVQLYYEGTVLVYGHWDHMPLIDTIVEIVQYVLAATISSRSVHVGPKEQEQSGHRGGGAVYS
jgi:hypothetical protein